MEEGTASTPVSTLTPRPSIMFAEPFQQVPTPPMSQAAVSPPDPGFLLDSSEHQPQQSQQPTLVSVSTTFFPGAGLDSSPEDLVILSSDSVFFYCHSTRLLAASDNGFNGLLRAHIKHNPTDFDSGQIHSFPDDSTVLNVVLHTIYSMSCSHYSPSHNTIQEAVAAMVRYGISLKAYIAPSSPLSSLFLANAAHNPLEIYAIAASFDLYELAASISVHLLSIPLCNITDELAIKIGPVYLRRLFFLHLGRIDALKRLLVSPPLTHEPTQECDLTDQKRVTRAWALASAYLAWDARPDLSTASIQAALTPLADHLTCERCKRSLRERVNELVAQWSVVKRTI